MKALDRDGRLLHVRRELGRAFLLVALERHVGARGEVWTPALAALRQPVPRDLRGLVRGLTHDGVELILGEPSADLGLKVVEVEAVRFVVGGQMNQVPDPVEVHRRVDAVVLQQRNRDARDRGRLHVREALLQHVDTADPDDRFDLAGFDHRPDDGRPLGHQHRVAQTLGFDRQVLNRAETALLTQQTEFVERRRALVFDTQTLRDKQQPTVVRNPCHGVAPGGVADQDGRVILVDRVQSGFLQDRAGVLPQLVHRERRNRADPFDVVRGQLLQSDPHLLVVGDVRLRAAVSLPRELDRQL